MASKTKNFPFPFFNHGLWSYKDEIKSAFFYVLFQGAVPEAERASLLEGRPAPAAGPARFAGDRILVVDSPPDRYFDAHIHRAYGPGAGAAKDDEEEDFELTKKEAQAFVDAFDAWLTAVHERHPIALVIAWNGDRKDAWSEWSVAELVPHVIPHLRNLIAGLRPPSEETRVAYGPERVAAWIAWSAVAAFFELGDAKALDQASRDAMAALMREAKGHDDMLEGKLDRILRILAKASPPAG